MFRDSKMIMGTVVQITVAGVPEERARIAIKEAFAEIERIDANASSHRQDGAIGRLNREGHLRNVLLDKDIFDLIRTGIAIGEQSRGGVKSHARRALSEGLTPDELRHAADLTPFL